jgi:hypothetical protein
VLTAIRGARLEGHLNGKTVAPATQIEAEQKKEDDKAKAKIKIDNPAYEEWFAADQQVLGFLFSLLSRDTTRILGFCDDYIMTITTYFLSLPACCDEMAVITEGGSLTSFCDHQRTSSLIQ